MLLHCSDDNTVHQSGNNAVRSYCTHCNKMTSREMFLGSLGSVHVVTFTNTCNTETSNKPIENFDATTVSRNRFSSESWELCQ